MEGTRRKLTSGKSETRNHQSLLSSSSFSAIADGLFTEDSLELMVSFRFRSPRRTENVENKNDSGIMAGIHLYCHLGSDPRERERWHTSEPELKIEATVF